MPSERYVDACALARVGGSWRRVVAADAFVRLAEAAEAAEVEVNLRFALDERGRPRAEGRCRLVATVCCCRCLREEAVEVESRIDLRIVASEAQADALMPEHDAVVGDGPMPIAELIEDDLLMSLPEVACRDRHACPHAPGGDIASGAGMASRASSESAQQRPFAAIAALQGKLRGH